MEISKDFDEIATYDRLSQGKMQEDDFDKGGRNSRNKGYTWTGETASFALSPVPCHCCAPPIPGRKRKTEQRKDLAFLVGMALPSA